MDKESDRLIFIPRDAGFFSVFNFFIGSLTTNKKIYPLFNKEIFLHIHKKNEQFAYWSENYNSWFDYFEPVSFFDNDNFHTSNDFAGEKITFGEISPKEFRDPNTSLSLYRNKDLFAKWRIDTNRVYGQYIRLIEPIHTNIENWEKSNIQTLNAIAVHYRHPIHSCESGPVYFKQYFDIIDSYYSDREIFLSTDTELAILVFKDRYGDRVKYINDTHRVSIDSLLSWNFKLLNYKHINSLGMVDGQGYELHPSILKQPSLCKIHTIQLLTEVFLLSRRTALICSLSNIPLAISYINPHINIHLLHT